MKYRLDYKKQYSNGKSTFLHHELPADDDQSANLKVETFIVDTRQEYIRLEPQNPPLLKPMMLVEIRNDGKERIVWMRTS